MSETANPEQKTPVESFFGVVTRGESYLNVLYLLISFPLGVFYFVFLVTGLSLAAGLLIIWIGVPIFLLVIVVWYGLAAFERKMAIGMLHVDIPPMTCAAAAGQSLWARLKAWLVNPVTWKSLAYLFAKFPFGILSFVISVTAISLTLALVTAPLTYTFLPINVGFWYVDTLEAAVLCAILGLVVGLLSLHAMNGLALLWGHFARLMLGSGRAARIEPEVGRPVIIP